MKIQIVAIYRRLSIANENVQNPRTSTVPLNGYSKRRNVTECHDTALSRSNLYYHHFSRRWFVVCIGLRAFHVNSRTKIPRIYVCRSIYPVSDNYLCIFACRVRFWVFRCYALFVHFVCFRVLFAFSIFLHIYVSHEHTKLVALIFPFSFFSRLVLRYFIVRVVSRSLPRSFRVNSTFQLNVSIAT